jgi:hypothetical protein
MHVDRVSLHGFSSRTFVEPGTEWTLIVNRRGLCDEAGFAELDESDFDFDWAASCGVSQECGGEPLLAGDTLTFGTRAFEDGLRTTVAYWMPAPAHALLCLLAGGALLCRSERLAAACRRMPLAEPPEEGLIVRLTRRAAALGDRCHVLPELLAIEEELPETKLLRRGFDGVAPGTRLARGVRASFREGQLATAVSWARHLARSR